MKQVKWFERNFDFNIEQNIFPSILKRLASTPIRLEEMCKSISPDILSISVNNTWTIKENIGHLADLEPLWQDRTEDIITGQPVLREADLQNKKTELANHDATPLEDLLLRFHQLRSRTLSKLEKIDDAAFSKYSLHPRLKKPMRIIDLFLFVAEHDDHHLNRITELAKTIKNTDR